MTPSEEAIEFVLRHEGGYVNHPDDPGGETNFGISKRSYPDEDIENLSRGRAAQIYFSDYWMPIRGDAFPVHVALPLMDYAVNSGVATAAKALQRAVGARVDGKIGPETISRAHAIMERRGIAGLAEDLILERALRLVRIGCKRKGSEAFLVGWMKRIRDNLRFVRSG